MTELSYIKTLQKAEVTREITFVLKDENNVAKKSKRELCNRIGKINQNLLERLECIAQISGLYPIRLNVKLSVPAWPKFDKNISNILNQFSDISNIRVVVNFEDIDCVELNSKILEHKNISHLIEVSFWDRDSKDLNELDGCTSSVYVSSVEKAIKVIEDIMLDIAIYYTIFDSEKFHKIDFRKEFSYTKVNKILKNNLSSDSWSIQSNKTYIALAGYFWTGLQFNYKAYLELWEEIAKELSYPFFTKIPTIENQLKRHKDYGELPINKIKKLYVELTPGEYILVRLNKIPRKEKTRISLLSVLGGKKLKRGKIKIFSKNSINQISNYSNYLSHFKLIK